MVFATRLQNVDGFTTLPDIVPQWSRVHKLCTWVFSRVTSDLGDFRFPRFEIAFHEEIKFSADERALQKDFLNYL